jgi:hypothetical protein
MALVPPHRNKQASSSALKLDEIVGRMAGLVKRQVRRSALLRQRERIILFSGQLEASLLRLLTLVFAFPALTKLSYTEVVLLVLCHTCNCG